ncbi:MAG: LamG domain-containing protein [Gammaproteobacteria bacterium]|nr:LamG domain-containing protein [Gammaproteobacteria bacterium]
MYLLSGKVVKLAAYKNTGIIGVFTIITTLTLSACGDSASTQTSIPPVDNTVINYTGPAPATSDIQAFKLNFWDNLSRDDRCGGCHIEGGSAPSSFVHKSNVNTAYLEAIKHINLDNYANSLMVTKVAGGHNCWLPDNGACADIIEGYIATWKGGEPNATGRQIVLTAPAIKNPGASRNFPTTAQDNDPNSFEKILYPLLTQHCAECHTEISATPISPFFSSNDVNSAYEAAKAKINLDSPADSRLVIRLREEFHNCWSANCLSDAQEIEDQINLLSSAITLTQVDASLITSKAVTLNDATIASGGSRYETNTIALWEFKTGSGTQTFDTSGVEPALNLTFSGAVDWVLGDGIEIINGKAQGSTANSKKLHDLIKATGEYSIESWLVPGNVSQKDTSIITYSAGGSARNFTVAQNLYNYAFLNRTNASNANGLPALSTADADEDLQASQQHVVMNYDPVNGRQIFVNGIFTDDVDTSSSGSNLTDWDSSFAFVLGDEPSGGALWKGKIRLVAIHNRALTQTQINQNFSVGVGKKYFMLFSIADRIGIPDSYILFHVEQYDNYAYLFNEPRFINLNPDWLPNSPIIIKGMRIAINGREAAAGQAFANIDTSVNSSSGYDFTNNGQFLSTQGTIIPLEKGSGSDEFFLTFEVLGSNNNPFIEALPIAPSAADDAEPVSDIGLRTFEEINATMSAVTGVPTTETTVSTTYNTYRQQLPVVENISTFLASHQMAIAQLAMSYCNVLVNTNPGYFSGFTFSTASTAFDSPAKKAAIMNPLLTAIMNVDINNATNNLQTQPDETVIRDMLGASTTQNLDVVLTGDDFESLITSMTQCTISPSPTCDTTTRTEEIVKASCAAILGSASMLIQ